MSPTPFQVIHEDAQLIVVDKPSGQVVIPGRGKDEGEPLVDQVTRHIGKKAFVVHRIDRETSGLVVFAKDAQTHQELSVLWEDRKVHKTYLALVQGVPSREEGTLDQPLKVFGSGRMGVDRKGKPSRTHYRIKESYGRAALLEVEPETGRRHQIRVHLYHLGHPVLGDTLYGEDRPVGGAPRLMLHASGVVIPWGGRDLHLACELPFDFLNFLKPFKAPN